MPAVQCRVDRFRLANDLVEVAMMLEELEEGLESGHLLLDPVVERRDRGLDLGAQAMVQRPDEVGEDRVLVREVEVEGPKAHASTLSDLRDAGLVVSGAAEHVLGRVDELLPGALPPRGHREKARGGRSAHGPSRPTDLKPESGLSCGGIYARRGGG